MDMKYAVEMGAGAMIYIPSFIMIQKLIEGVHRQHGDQKSFLLFFQNKESRPKADRIIVMWSLNIVIP
jgi:hypothetical protein